MKPTFALDLSRDVIALLHRTPKGWLTVGEVAFDAPDLAEALDYLRKTALGLSPLGLTCKVILPNSQVLYTEVQAPGPSREDKRRQIAAALHGRTPYPVDDLVFDWSGKGTTACVAVVARETLEEAEAFAMANRLNPVSFVATPAEGGFAGEAWFGPSNSTDTILAPGEMVERDQEPVVIIGRASPAPTEVAPPPQADPALPGLAEALAVEVTEAEATEAEAAAEAATVANAEADEIAPPIAPAEASGAPAVVSVPAPVTVVSAPTPVAVAPSPAEPAAKVEAPGPILDPKAPEPAAKAPEPAKDSATAAKVGDGKIPDVALAADILDLDTDLPPAPSPAAMLAFSSRRSPSVLPRSGRTVPPVTASRDKAAIPHPAPVASPPASPVAAPVTAPVTAPAKARFAQGPVTAPSIPGLGPKPKPIPESGGIPRPVPDQAAPARPTTVKPAAALRPSLGNPLGKGQRAGFAFMVMIGLLLLCLALVAAWASFYLTQNGEDGGTDSTTAVAEAPSVEDEMAADMQAPEDEAMADPAATDPAALAGAGSAVNIGGDSSGPQPTTAVDDALAATALTGDPAAGSATEGAGDGSGEAAPGTTIATDVSGGKTAVEDQDRILMSAVEVEPPILDALALPTPDAAADAPPDAAMAPPAFGTVYQFDAQGLLLPTPEGILSPAGIMLFSGPPPVVPPARSPVAAAAAAAAAPPGAADVLNEPAPSTAADASLVTSGAAAAAVEATGTPAEPVASDPAMAGFRPKPRPPGVTKPDDGASLTPGSASEFAGLHPLDRPATITAAATAPGSAPVDLGAQGASLEAQAEARQAAAAALEAANPSIVAISMRPMARPSDLSRAVEDAVAAAVMEPDPGAGAEVELAAAAPAAKPEEIDEMAQPETDGAAPKIPTKANVAKEATYANVLNLSKTALIGTYGTASAPYALVRQSNGRYRKVEVGDRLDGGVVMAITESELRYQKGGKLVTLKMPSV